MKCRGRAFWAQVILSLLLPWFHQFSKPARRGEKGFPAEKPTVCESVQTGVSTVTASYPKRGPTRNPEIVPPESEDYNPGFCFFYLNLQPRTDGPADLGKNLYASLKKNEFIQKINIF